MRHPREERGVGPTRSRGSFFSPPRKTACLASGSNPRSRAKGIQRPDVSKPQVRLSRGALRVTSAGDVLPGRQGADLSRTLKDPQQLLSLPGLPSSVFCYAGGQFFQGAEGPHGEIDGVSHFIPFSLLCLSHVWTNMFTCLSFCT